VIKHSDLKPYAKENPPGFAVADIFRF
jgi:hypothetical protein